MTMRSIQDRFWSDLWVRKLNPLDRYLFIYLLTNEHTNWCGIYELDLGMMAYESGIDERDLERSMLPRLHPKIIYVDGWVYVPNWVKHHMSEGGNLSPQQKKGMETAWSTVPERIRLRIKAFGMEGIPSPYPMHTVSASASSFASASISELRSRTYEIRTDPDLTGESGDSKSLRISGDKKKAYDELIAWSEKERGFVFPPTFRTKQYKAFKLANQNGITRDQLMDRWNDMSTEKFWQKNGYDWLDVFNSFSKKSV